jgi:hypothetical protein
MPPVPTIAWRQQAAEVVVRRASALQAEGRHLLLADHQAFAASMRGHAGDPRHMQHVLTTNGWEGMRWERLSDLDPSDGGWAVHVIDTSRLSTGEVGEEVLTWCRRALDGGAPLMRVGSGGPWS